MVTLDTCTLLWLSLKPTHLSVKAKKAIAENALSISDITLWEIAMLIQLNRVHIDAPYCEFIELLQSSFDLTVYPISPAVAHKAVTFGDTINKDPADRIIAATSLINTAPLVTGDKNLRRSKAIATIW